MLPPRIAQSLVLTIALQSPVCMAAVRCDLAVSSQVGACLDPRTLKGQTLQVPANITRIGEDGLALCTPTNTQVLSSDIVLCHRQLEEHDGGRVLGRSRHERYNLAHRGLLEPGVRREHGSSSLPALRRHYGCRFPGHRQPLPILDSDEPQHEQSVPRVERSLLHARPGGTRRHRLQAAFDPESKAGVIYFNSAVKQRFPMRTLDPASQKTLTDAVGMYTSASGTLWAPPFDTAFRWLASTPVTGRSKAIILVSDGEPPTRRHTASFWARTDSRPSMPSISANPPIRRLNSIRLSRRPRAENSWCLLTIPTVSKASSSPSSHPLPARMLRRRRSFPISRMGRRRAL